MLNNITNLASKAATTFTPLSSGFGWGAVSTFGAFQLADLLVENTKDSLHPKLRKHADLFKLGLGFFGTLLLNPARGPMFLFSSAIGASAYGVSYALNSKDNEVSEHKEFYTGLVATGITFALNPHALAAIPALFVALHSLLPVEALFIAQTAVLYTVSDLAFKKYGEYSGNQKFKDKHEKLAGIFTTGVTLALHWKTLIALPAALPNYFFTAFTGKCALVLGSGLIPALLYFAVFAIAPIVIMHLSTNLETKIDNWKLDIDCLNAIKSGAIQYADEDKNKKSQKNHKEFVEAYEELRAEFKKDDLIKKAVTKKVTAKITNEIQNSDEYKNEKDNAKKANLVKAKVEEALSSEDTKKMIRSEIEKSSLSLNDIRKKIVETTPYKEADINKKDSLLAKFNFIKKYIDKNERASSEDMKPIFEKVDNAKSMLANTQMSASGSLFVSPAFAFITVATSAACHSYSIPKVDSAIVDCKKAVNDYVNPIVARAV